MWSGHQKPQVQPEAGPAEPGTGFNYFRVRNVRFVNTPDVFCLFSFLVVFADVVVLVKL